MNIHRSVDVIIRRSMIFLTLIFGSSMLLSLQPVWGSDLSDATTLREKCEKEVKVIEVAVKNFGSDGVLKDFQSGGECLKTAKLMMAQSNYVDAKKKYGEYLTIQSGMYKSLAAIYIERTDTINKEVTSDLVDFIDNEKVATYFKLANQNLVDAKSNSGKQYYKQAVELCRNAKKYALGAYKIVNKDVPSKYAKDMADSNR